MTKIECFEYAACLRTGIISESSKLKIANELENQVVRIEILSEIVNNHIPNEFCVFEGRYTFTQQVIWRLLKREEELILENEKYKEKLNSYNTLINNIKNKN